MRNFFLRLGIAKFKLQKKDENGHFIFSLKEDLDCSGLPTDGETKCDFDAGMITGLLSSYYKRDFFTKETGCWGTGNKSCVFKSIPAKQEEA
ncbi:V4R domain-containing protein [Gemmatimonadota bacterium]